MVKKTEIIAMIIIGVVIIVLSNCKERKTPSKKEPQIETVKVIKMELVKESKNGNCSLKVFYPQIGGLSNARVEKKINAELISKFISEDAVSDIENCQPEDRYNIEVTYSVKLNMKNVLSIMMKNYMVTPGGGSTLLEGVTINVKNGQLYKYEDLFRPDTNYIFKINKLVWGDIEEDEPSVKTKMKTTKYEFYITENELVILPIISPKMPNELPISLSEISDIINPEGPLGSLMKR